MNDIKRLMKGELIGMNITIIASPNASLIGKTGKVVDETKNTFTIHTSAGTKKIIKAHQRFQFEINKKKINVEGKILVARPEDRIKRISR